MGRTATSVVGGFSTNEPFIYKSLGVDVAYQVRQ